MTNGRGGLASSDPAIGAPAAAAPDPASEKRAVRAAAKTRRAAAHAALAALAPRAVAQRLAGLLADRARRLGGPGVLAGYVPIRDEMDVLPALDLATLAGWRCALPAVLASATPLEFRPWQAGAALEEGAFRVPAPPAAAGTVRPDVVLVPMLAFDAAGRRMGYGAGFYDRTLEGLRRDGSVLAIGIAYAAQQQAWVPTGPHDQPLDLIVTEAAILTPSAAAAGA